MLYVGTIIILYFMVDSPVTSTLHSVTRYLITLSFSSRTASPSAVSPLSVIGAVKSN